MKKNALLLLACVFTWSATAHENTVQKSYQLTRVLPEYPFGWFGNEAQLRNLFETHNIRIVVEIGSWVGGGSTRYMGNLLKRSQDRHMRKKKQDYKPALYAVDTWLGSLEHQPGQSAYDPILPQLYEQFLSNMIHWNLTDVVVPCRMTSQEAARTLNVQPDLVYIDGDHSTEAVYADLTAWYPIVKEHGILCGDDWLWDSVRTAVEQFADENNLHVYASGNFWHLIPK